MLVHWHNRTDQINCIVNHLQPIHHTHTLLAILFRLNFTMCLRRRNTIWRRLEGRRDYMTFQPKVLAGPHAANNLHSFALAFGVAHFVFLVIVLA